MRGLRLLVIAALLSAVSVAYIGCQPEEEGAMEDIGKSMDQKAAEAEKAAEKAAEEMDEVIE